MIELITIVGCVTGGQSISDKANSRLGNLWNIIPSSIKLFEEQEISLQIKDSGVAYFFMEFTENKLCILKILLPKNKAGTGRMNMLSQNQNKSNEISNLKKKNHAHETTVSITKIKSQIKSLHSKHGSKVLKIINSVGNWKIYEILV